MFCYIFSIENEQLCIGVSSIKEFTVFEVVFGTASLRESYISFLHRIGTSTRPGKRQIIMSSFGCTMSASTTPRLMCMNGKTVFIPRPYVNYRPFTQYHKDFNLCYKLRNLIQFIEKWCLTYLTQRSYYDSCAKKVLHEVMEVSKLVPRSCRIYDTFFTYMSVNGNMQSSSTGIGKHIDQDDLLDFVLHIGEDSDDGGTIYFESKEGDRIVSTVRFVNGRCQLGNYGKIYHGTQAWKGNRCSITLAVKHTVLKFFREYGRKPYDDLITRNRFACPNKIFGCYKKLN